MKPLMMEKVASSADGMPSMDLVPQMMRCINIQPMIIS
jgi:hypothetical protein